MSISFDFECFFFDFDGNAPRRQPYLDIEEYNTLVAKNASKAAEGLCAWTKAMCSYQAASKIVKPKLEALKLAEAKLAEAQKELDKAEAKLQGVMDVLNKLQKQFEDQMAVKAEIEAGAKKQGTRCSRPRT